MNTPDAMPSAMAQRFLLLLDSDPNAIFYFRTLADKPGEKGASKYSGTFEQCKDKLSRDNAAGRGVFVVVNGGGHAAKEITRVRALFADCDNTKQPWTSCAIRGRDPHMLVETSPGKWHAYWRVNDVPLTEFKRMQSEIAAAFGTDPSVTDLPRIMRLPGFLHNKRDPTLVRMFWWSDRAAFGAAELQAHPWGQAIPDHIPKGCRNTELARIAGGLRHKGADYDQIVAKLLAVPIEGEMELGEIERIAKSVCRYPVAAAPLPLPLPAPTPARVRNAADLMKQTFKPVQWAIRDILPEGVTILSGDPKIGKSWLVYQMCIAVAAGVPLWPGRSPEIGGDALYLDLEGNDRRLQRRLQTLLKTFPAGTSTARLHFATDWPRAEQGVEDIAKWLREHPNCRLVVIDTVSAFRDNDPGRKSMYAHDYAVGEILKPLAREFNCAIVIVMHNRKQAAADNMQKVSGTQGITGSVDNVLVLERNRGAMDAALHVDGRDIEEPSQLALEHKDAAWRCIGNVADVQRSKERNAVIEAIRSMKGVANAKEIHEAIPEKKFGAIKTMLSKMVKAGELSNEGGIYTLGKFDPLPPVDMCPLSTGNSGNSVTGVTAVIAGVTELPRLPNIKGACAPSEIS